MKITIEKMKQGLLVLSGEIEVGGSAEGAALDFAREAAKTALMSRIDAEAGKAAKTEGIALGEGFRNRFFSSDEAGMKRALLAIAAGCKSLPKGIEKAEVVILEAWTASAPQSAKVASLEAELAALKAELAASKVKAADVE